MAQKLERAAALVLGKALLWRVFDESGAFIADSIRTRIRRAYEDLGDQCTLETAENPVKKVPIAITRDEAEYLIDELDDEEQGEVNIGNDGAGANTNERRRLTDLQYRILLSSMRHLQRDVAALGANSERRGRQVDHRLATKDRNINRLSIVQARRTIRAQNAENEEEGNAGSRNRISELSRLPKTLHALWQEYQFGSGNKKAAKDFTPQERGKSSVKHKYYLRKCLWEQVAEMVQSGMDADVACDRI